MNSRKGQSKYLFRFVCGIIETGINSGLFVLFWVGLISLKNPAGHLKGKVNILMAIGIYTAILFVLWRTLGGYRIGVNRIVNIISSQVVGILLTNLINTVISMAVTGQFRLAFLLLREYICLWMLQSIVTSFVSFFAIRIYQLNFPPLNIVEIFGDNINNLDEKIDSRPDKYIIRRRIYYTENESTIKQCIEDYDAVIINDIPARDKNRILKLCFDMDKRVYFTPKLSDIIIRTSEDLNLFDTPLYLCRNGGISSLQRFCKRFFDIVLSFMALIILSPVMIITAIAIKLEDRGPIFYRQERVTIGNRRFMIIKFRSMIPDAEKDGKPNPARVGDSRITRTGQFIRSYRIDELPQLFNILKGEMSIVGPRPERVEHVEKYTEEISEFSFRNKFKGGLTGYAQVYGKYNTTALDKLKLDLEYIMNYSLILDLQIILETIKVLFQKESTEGFRETPNSSDEQRLPEP